MGTHYRVHRRNPSELRLVFGNNLRALIGNETSVSGLCRNLGINRTQFNRYLSGESFPRPDVLAVICEHFDVDARILLEPLDEVDARRSGATAKVVGEYFTELGKTGVFTTETRLMKDGFYIYYLGPITKANIVLGIFVMIRTEPGGLTFAHFYLPREFAESIDLDPRYRRARAIVTQNFTGVSLFGGIRSKPLLVSTVLEPGYMLKPTLFRGQTMANSRLPLVEDFTANTMMEYLGDTYRDLLDARELVGMHKMSNLPHRMAKHFAAEIVTATAV